MNKKLTANNLIVRKWPEKKPGHLAAVLVAWRVTGGSETAGKPKLEVFTFDAEEGVFRGLHDWAFVLNHPRTEILGWYDIGRAVK